MKSMHPREERFYAPGVPVRRRLRRVAVAIMVITSSALLIGTVAHEEHHARIARLHQQADQTKTVS
jgi:hypothetical protein